ncbi:MAG: LysM peptidoglycan-binding domain-containing protein [Lachnospiraceae bacterium]|nr:LysM peptidoglycan-binding domain-containing protein [Lachnospiraceae bacterium]
MIEVIYQGEKEVTTKEEELKLPKNVRQIGDCVLSENGSGNYSPGDIKIYVEDFVMTYIKHFNSNNLRYGVLLGDVKKSNGYTYFFVKGTVLAKPVLDTEVIFDDKVWTGMYEEIKMYFEEVEILGWFVSLPGMLENDMLQIQKMHLDNFAGNDRICFVLDRIECEDSFYYYSDGGMKKCGGHFIYYEKNEDMQSYMVMNEEVSEVPKDYEQTKKRFINAKVHKLLYRSDEIEKEKRLLPTFAYSASSFMIIAVLLVTIAIMNASGQMQELKSVVAGISKNENNKNTEVSSSVEIVEVGTNPEIATTKKEVEQDMSSEEEITKELSSEETTEALTSTEKIDNEQQTSEAVPSVVPNKETTGTYVVKAGDSLYSISIKMYGTSANVEKIKELNNLKNENFIKEGDTILLP